MSKNNLFYTAILISCLLLPINTYASNFSAENETNDSNTKQPNFLIYDPYADIEEAKIKVVSSLEGIRKEREEIQVLYMRHCNESYYNSYKELVMAGSLGLDEKSIRKAALRLKKKMAPYMADFQAYYLAHSHHGITLPFMQLIEQDPSILISAISKDTNLPENKVKEVFSDIFG